MIFKRSVQREFANTAAGVFVALFAILITTQLIRLLGQAAGGKLASEGVLALLGFGALNYMPVVLTLTVFVSILLTLSRSYRDSEMMVWFSSGLPLTAWVSPVLRFSLPIIFVIALLSLFLSPWALQKSAEFRGKLASRDDVSQISPGNFRESSDGNRVFFVDGMAEDASHVKNVFVSSMQHGRLGVMVAAEGYTETAPNGDRFLVLQRGRRYEGVAGTPDYRESEFEAYSIRIEQKEAPEVGASARTMRFHKLFREPTLANLGEIVWRIGLPVSALVLALLAIPLSFVNPRAGRSLNLILALLIYVTYSNLTKMVQALVAQGKVSFIVGLGAVHLVMVVVLLALFWRRIAVYSWFRMRR
ncbi:MAG TPA: LPS export ABC transporter permease LptF [Rhodocyclaceae bacterium]|nr:LPS export ABC transporter permease LptF [Rhodocyclaceae bacterium]HMV52258.1 LPS export ABC transporter permease LptF [Rhodocyclaceae bacterium]HMZ83559.1 LPS export ABC transporter permease LptF [Rhodocyclaceae bacterium]HNA04233.1 LPS export ABC transporter permease LptF [Rhodocyclaceae bacterium]HNB80216.1 LPS export ABC transporter permease LptF [Rhodocyclaceae bacterium]